MNTKECRNCKKERWLDENDFCSIDCKKKKDPPIENTSKEWVEKIIKEIEPLYDADADHRTVAIVEESLIRAVEKEKEKSKLEGLELAEKKYSEFIMKNFYNEDTCNLINEGFMKIEDNLKN